jgi:iron(II)-dependent oxidoreductase
MSRIYRFLPWLTAAAAAAAFGFGLVFNNAGLIGAGSGGLVGFSLIAAANWNAWGNRSKARRHDDRGESSPQLAKKASLARPSGESHAADGNRSAPADVDSLVKQMLDDGRFALLLRPQIAGNLPPEMLTDSQEELDRQMALVPDGEVKIEPNRLSAVAELDVPEEALHPVPVRVSAMYLDRHPVTNEQYQAFVDAGGYEQIAIWDPAIWPAVLDFVDSTGHAGPRYWANGRFPDHKADHPVVGVCWYEAAAFCRWVGRRLPTDAEWVKAASWPVNLGPNNCVQRKYPWGNTMDRQRANLWGSGPGETVAVDEFSSGVSVGGAYQLIGNVWEWTADDFLWIAALVDQDSQESLLKTIRGGAFDTYFDNQATCQFASGENPLGRKHNIGFRCGLGLCDLSARESGSSTVEAALEPPSEDQETIEDVSLQAV